MKILTIVLLCLVGHTIHAKKTIHVFVALCDNKNQGIVPVPSQLGNGQNPSNNLYWGALYGVKTFLNNSQEWEFLKTISSTEPEVLERVLFKSKNGENYLLADAYDGAHIQKCTESFLRASNMQQGETILHDHLELHFGGKSDILAYVGHDGLMDFSVNINYNSEKRPKAPDVIILACASKQFFSDEIREAGANPILWTTNLMAPEAYVLDASIRSWIEKSHAQEIVESAAAAYHKYQKCGMNGARNLFASGF